MMNILSAFGRVGSCLVVSGCLVGILTGCHTKLKTSSVSGQTPATPQVAAQQPVPSEAQPAVQKPVQGETIQERSRTEIPVEEPARPVLRPSGPAGIFATPRTEVGKYPVSPSPSQEAPLVEEAMSPPAPGTAERFSTIPSQESPSIAAIPPMSFEPESPALPTIRQEAALPEEPAAGEEPTAKAEAVLPSAPMAQEEALADEAPMAHESPIQDSVSASIPRPEDQPMEPGEPATDPQEPVQMANVMPEASEPVANRIEDPLRKLEDVFFDYDRFSIREEAIQVLEENAEALVAGLSDKHLVIEGHCDERGTESYNMVLGKRRANAVKEYLVGLGIPGDQLQVVSYGKEKPFCTDQNEACWQENRRGHFVLK